MKDLIRLFVFLSITVVSIDALAFVNSVTSTPDTPTVCDAFTLRVDGDLPGTNYAIQSVSQNISGDTITLDIFIVDQGIGLPILVPYFVNFNYSGLDAGTYHVIANDYLDGSLSSTVTSSLVITGFTSAFTSNITNTTATLNWSEIPCACGYLLKGRPVGASNYIFVLLPGSTPTTFNVSNLVPGTAYQWQVLTNCPATGADTMRAKTPIVTFTTTNCNSPNPVSTTSVTSSSATLNWTAVSGAIGYEIWGRAVGGSIVVLPINNGSTTSFTVNNLPSATTFQWAARTKCASNPNVFSGFSSIETFTTAAASEKNVDAGAGQSVKIIPNPFNASAEITVPENADATYTLVISDISGRQVQLYDQLNAGTYTLTRDGLPSGIYFYELRSANSVYSGKFLVN